MKNITLLFLLISGLCSAQQDTLALGQDFLDKYAKIERMAFLEEVKECAVIGDELYNLKNRKAPLALMLGNTYYRMGTEYKTRDTGNNGIKFRGYLPVEEQKEALAMAKKYYSEFLEHHSANDDKHRNALNGLDKINRLLAEF